MKKPVSPVLACGLFALFVGVLFHINVQEYKSIQNAVVGSSSSSDANTNFAPEGTITSSSSSNNNIPKEEREENVIHKVASMVMDKEEEKEEEESKDKDKEDTTAASTTNEEENTTPTTTNGDGDTTIERPKWWDSSKSTVIALAAGYGLSTYKQFVGSLRATGYKGNIILGIGKNPPSDVKSYLQQKNVIMKEVPLAEKCTYTGQLMENGEPSKKLKCAAAYPDYKLSWGRFPLARDWLLECEDCTGGVMLTDSRDAYFQTDPFRYPFGDKPMEYLPGELMVFEEIAEQKTDHWITSIPVEKCRKYKLLDRPMLCSGSTMGTRQGILNYIDSMIKEFDYWKEQQECRSDMAGDDQSIHNHLYYSSQFQNAVAIPHRMGPIHIVGVQADQIFRSSIQKAADQGFGGGDLMKAESFINRVGYMDWDDEIRWHQKKRVWLPSEYELIDPKTGFITNLDGKPSPQVHQFDRFGLKFDPSDLIKLNYNTRG